MALHSIDENTQSVDASKIIRSNGNTWINPVVDGDANSVPQIMIGYYPDAWGTGKNYGIKVSKPTVDVRTATDINTVMSSAYKNFKVTAYGGVTLNKSASTVTGTATVSLGSTYYPAFTCFTNAGINYYALPYVEINTTTGAVNLQVKAYADGTNINFEVTAPSGGSRYASGLSIPISYYLYVETST